MERAIVHRDLYGVRVLQRREAALLPNYFGQTCFVMLLFYYITTDAADCMQSLMPIRYKRRQEAMWISALM